MKFVNLKNQKSFRILKTQYAHQTVLPLHTDKDVVDLYNKEDIVFVAKYADCIIFLLLFNFFALRDSKDKDFPKN